MKLRLIHSCMVLGVLALLFCYSVFLTSPQFIDENSNHFIRSSDEGRRGEGGIDVPVVPPPEEPIAGDTKKRSLPQDPEETKTIIQSLLTSVLNSGEPSEETHSQQQLQRTETDEKRNDGNSQVPQVSPSKPEGPSGESKAATVPQQTLFPPKFLPVTTRDIHESGFSYANPALCPNDGEDVRLFIMITSAPKHFSARDAIRLTWAHYAQRMDISLAFLIGRTEDTTVVEGMEVEKHLYDDLIVANFVDTYDNLTLKTMATLEWMDTHCSQSQFTLKTDDDMFINIPNLLNFISRIEEDDAKEGKIYGRLAKKWKPVRNKKSKYFISFQQFKKSVYPDFTTGPAYLFATRLSSQLLAKGLENTYLKLEDVYTTGLLAEELGIKRVNIADFANKKVNFHKTGYCALSRLISMHMVAFHEQFDLWKRLLDGRTKCKIVYQDKKIEKKMKETKNKESSGGGVTAQSPPMSQ